MSGKLTLISSSTASNSASISFTSGIDSTYDEYQIILLNVVPATDAVDLLFGTSTDTGSTWTTTKTTSYFKAHHSEDDGTAELVYDGTYDLAQSTSDATLAHSIDNDADSSCCGFLTIYAPSDTTFVKHFVSRISSVVSAASNLSCDCNSAGYINTTSAVDAIRFSMSSGNISSGDFYLYGVS